MTSTVLFVLVAMLDEACGALALLRCTSTAGEICRRDGLEAEGNDDQRVTADERSAGTSAVKVAAAWPETRCNIVAKAASASPLFVYST